MVISDNLYHLDSTYELVCLFVSAGHALHLLDIIAKHVVPFGRCFTLSKYKVALWDWMTAVRKWILGGEELTIVDRSSCLGSTSLKGGSRIVEVGTSIYPGARAAYLLMKNL